MTQKLQLLLEHELGVPFTKGNSIQPLQNGDEIFPSMLNAIHDANSTIDFLTFVYWTGEVATKLAEALAIKSRQGVKVRVLLDSFGAKSISSDLVNEMKDANIDIRWFRPISTWRFWNIDNRTHRKVLVIDKSIAFTGGVGIAKEWEGDASDPNEWRDTHFKIKGPAVYGLQSAFSSNWAETERPQIDNNLELNHTNSATSAGAASIQIIRATASIGWSDIATVIEILILTAKTRIRIASAYFVPDERIVNCFAKAIDRGVTIDVMFPGQYTDKRVSQLAGEESFESLLSIGVNLWKYQKTMLHTKIILVDEEVLCIGSANFNQRSMRKDDEVVVTVIDKICADNLHLNFNKDLKFCEPVTLEDWKSRGMMQKISEMTMKRFKSQL